MEDLKDCDDDGDDDEDGNRGNAVPSDDLEIPYQMCNTRRTCKLNGENAMPCRYAQARAWQNFSRWKGRTISGNFMRCVSDDRADA